MRFKTGSLCVALVTIACAGAGCAAKQTGKKAEGSGLGYLFGLDSVLGTLYPNSNWLPPPYSSSYPSYIGPTIQLFTEQSLTRDGIAYRSVTVQMLEGTWFVNIDSADPMARAYATIQPTFFDQLHAQQALAGVQLCMNTKGCWNPSPVSGQPWAMFLPLGMAMVNQKSVMFLDYPPDTSLIAKDYLNNFTIDRWTRILSSVGIQTPALYETTVDSRPIAAAGSGQTSALPDPQTYFNAAGTGHFYTTPMLRLLTDPPSNKSATNTIPLGVFGGPAEAEWAAILGVSKVKPGDVGAFTLPGNSKSTPWIADNHPDVTTYQCCPGDTSSACQDPGYPPPDQLIPDEQLDLVTSCYLQSMAGNPAQDPKTVKAACETQWGGPLGSLPPATQQIICVNAALDNNDPAVRCATPADAQAFCAAQQNNPCPTYPFTCPSTGAKSVGAAARPRLPDARDRAGKK